MTTAFNRPDGPRTFGGWGFPPQFGIGKGGPMAFYLRFGGLAFFVVLLAVFGPLVAVPFLLVLGAAMLVLTIKNQHHKTVAQRASVRWAFWRARSKGATVLSQGPLGQVGYGDYRPPGMHAASTLEQWQDPYDEPFSILSVPNDASSAVTLLCDPNGGDLLDQGETDQRVTRYGYWLGGLGAEPHLLGAAVTVETRPDTGTAVAREVETQTVANAHPIASAVMAEVVQTYPQGAPKLTAYTTLTFADDGRKPEDVSKDLRVRMAGLRGALSGTGAGAVRPASADQLCRIVRASYDPTATRQWEHLPAAERPLLTWNQVGPVHAVEHRDRYEHDGAVSVTYEVTEAPRGLVTEKVLARLLDAHPDIERKRVTIFYRPIDPATTARIVDRDLMNAETRVRSAPRSGRAKAALESAQRTAAEEAQGAGLVMFSMMITVTVTDPARLTQACTTVENLAAASRLTVRRLYGHQAVGFAATLPLGLITSRHLRLPPVLREAI